MAYIIVNSYTNPIPDTIFQQLSNTGYSDLKSTYNYVNGNEQGFLSIGGLNSTTTINTDGTSKSITLELLKTIQIVSLNFSISFKDNQNQDGLFFHSFEYGSLGKSLFRNTIKNNNYMFFDLKIPDNLIISKGEHISFFANYNLLNSSCSIFINYTGTVKIYE